MDVSLLQQLVDLMSANDLNTVDIRDGDRRIILKRGVPQPAVSMPAAMHAMHAPPPPPGVPARVAEPAGGDETEAGLVAVRSPMVGTFYAAASPDARPYVTVGSAVTEDTDVCIIEAMKVFNNIKAECRGVIAKILVQNGQTVEFGQVLFLVKPK
jgi:acetyl-CoA carboxylase biotin carboxyl carrier protein